MSDQPFYDLMFALKRAIVLLAAEARAERELRAERTVRALRAEAMLRNTRAERDFWRELVRRNDAVQRRWRAKKRSAA